MLNVCTDLLVVKKNVILTGGIQIFLFKELIKFVAFFLILNIFLHLIEVPLSEAVIIALVSGVVSFLFNCHEYHNANKK